MSDQNARLLDENEALVGVIRPSGQAMFHTQDCAHAKRAMSAHYYLPSDFAPGDVWCSVCRPDQLARSEQNGENRGN